MDVGSSKQSFTSRILYQINMRMWWKLCRIRD